MLNVQRILDTDILIVGGGIAGLMAAICAGEQGIATIVAEKAHVRRSGSGATGNDHFLCFMPEIQKITLKEMINEMMAGQVGPWHDTLLTKVFLERTAEMVHRWHSWGINMKPFGPDYVYMGHAFPDRPRMYVKYDGHNQKEILVKKAKENGALFLNHHPVTDLLAEDGRVTGALLMDVREDEPRFTLVRAGAVVIHEANTITAAHRPLQAFEFDATNCPDLFPALAALAAAADGVSVLHGTSRLTYKECNRADAIRDEYARLGIEVDTSEENVMKIRGGAVHGAVVDSHNDHRMAMSLAVAALRADRAVTIRGAESVAKSYPEFFEALEQVRS